MKKRYHPKRIKKHFNSHAREIALQGIYQVDVGRKALQEEVMSLSWMRESPPENVKDYARALLKGVYQDYQRQESLIKKHSHKDMGQISRVVNAILHIGIYELSTGELSQTIIIDDLLQLVGKYDGEESVAFVNGILDSYYREQVEKQTEGRKGL